MSNSQINNNLIGFDEHSIVHYQNITFTEKNVYSLKNNPMCGVTLWQWINIYRKNNKLVALKYFHRVVFITIISIFNALLFFVEWLLNENEIKRTSLPSDPVFIIGHPRTGTTLLHNLLSSRSEDFYFCTTFCAGFPSCFLWFEEIGKIIFSGVIEKTRPMDMMPLHFDLPQEDECATNLLSFGRSYYMPLWFMSQEIQFRKYFYFSSELGATNEDEEIWTQSFMYFMRKLTLRAKRRGFFAGKHNPKLLIKSPIHTARVPLLRKLFPHAKFIYIHRNPYEVLQSAIHMADTAYWYTYLNSPSNEQILEFILWQFQAMWEQYSQARLTVSTSTTTTSSESDSIDNDNKERGYTRRNKDNNENNAQSTCTSNNIANDIIEVSYHDFIERPLDNLQAIYSHIGFDMDDCNRRQHFEIEVKSLSSYKKNYHHMLSKDVKMMIEKRWENYFQTFSYNYD